MTATTRAGEWGGREMDGETVGTIVNAIANIVINAVECVGIVRCISAIETTSSSRGKRRRR